MLEVKNLKKSFGKVDVLKGIDFKIEKGDRVAIIGPSGCGKSTLLRCLNMIEKPTSGEIIYKHKNIITSDDLYKVRQKIGMVFQQFNLFPHLTVEKNIILAPVKLGLMSEATARKKSNELLKKIGLYDKRNNYPNQLSGGQQQRVLIARAMCATEKVIILDEPTNGLDPSISNQIYEMLAKMNKKRNLTVVMVSHDVHRAINYCNKVIELKDGEVTYIGEPKNYRAGGAL